MIFTQTRDQVSLSTPGPALTSISKVHSPNCSPEETIIVILTIQRSSSLPGWLLKAAWPCPKALNSSQVRHLISRSIPQNYSPEETIIGILTIQRSSSLPVWLLKAAWLCPKALNSFQDRQQLPRSIPQNRSPKREIILVILTQTIGQVSPSIFPQAGCL